MRKIIALCASLLLFGASIAREKKNAALIKQYENYGAEYYDSFGR